MIYLTNALMFYPWAAKAIGTFVWRSLKILFWISLCVGGLCILVMGFAILKDMRRGSSCRCMYNDFMKDFRKNMKQEGYWC